MRGPLGAVRDGVMEVEKKLVAVALVAATVLVGCGRSDGFKDEAEKERAWEKAQCRSLTGLDSSTVALMLSTDVSAGTLEGIRSDQALGMADRLNDGKKVSTVAREVDGRCAGPLWDWWKAQADYRGEGKKVSYESFTREYAEKQGYL